MDMASTPPGQVVMVVEGWHQRGHNEGTSLREDTGYDEKCRDEKTQGRSVAEDLPQGRGGPALFHPGLTWLRSSRRRRRSRGPLSRCASPTGSSSTASSAPA